MNLETKFEYKIPKEFFYLVFYVNISFTIDKIHRNINYCLKCKDDTPY